MRMKRLREATNGRDVWVGNLNCLERKWDDIIKTNLNVICCVCVDWIQLAQDRLQWQFDFYSLASVRNSSKAGKFCDQVSDCQLL
jgi:hypothetical protein